MPFKRKDGSDGYTRDERINYHLKMSKDKSKSEIQKLSHQAKAVNLHQKKERDAKMLERADKIKSGRKF